MARRGFGGSGDYSSFFSGLYNFNKDTNRAAQDAADQDAADKWANGLMSDAEWLEYIRTAVDREAGDPKRQQRWVTALRKYSTLIADKQAEQAYSSGGSIAELIAHYTARMGGMVQDSNEFRETQLRVNDLIDEQTGNSLQDKADAVIIGIANGTSTYQDLKVLLQDALEASRPNSSLRNSIEKQIKNVNETVRSNRVEGEFERLQYEYDAGKINGFSYAKSLRAMAGQFQVNDPKRYYQILQAAVTLERGGGGFKGAGGGGGTTAINKTIDGLQAQRNVLLGLMEQFDAGARKGVDPASGAIVVFTPGKVREIDLQILNAHEALATAYTSKGDQSAAAGAQSDRVEYLAKSVVTHNTMAADESWAQFYGSAIKVLDDALQNPDPSRALTAVAVLAKQAGRFSMGLTHEVIPKKGGGGPRDPTPGDEKGLIDAVQPDFADSAAALASALQILSTSGIDEASASAAMESLGALGGQRADGSPAANPFLSLGSKALEINGRVEGMATGAVERIATKDGIIWARTTPVTMSVPDPLNPANQVQIIERIPTSYRDPVTGEERALSVDEGKGSQFAEIYVDVNGRPTKMKAVATSERLLGLDAWVADTTKAVDGVQLIKGQVVTDSQLQTLLSVNGRTLEGLVASGTLTQGPAFETWQVSVPGFTDKNGVKHASETWSQDTATKLWYKGTLPIRGVERDPKTGMVRIGPDGRPVIKWGSFASAAGVPAVYAGSDPRAMQTLANGDPKLLEGVRTRNLLGDVSDDPYDIGGAYWDPVTSAGGLAKGDTWWKDSERKARSEAKKADFASAARRDRPGRTGRVEGTASTDDLLASGTKKLAVEFGVNLGGTSMSPGYTPRPEQGADRWAAMGDFFAQQQAPSKSNAPVVRLPDPLRTATGPSVKAEIALSLLTPSKPFVPRIDPLAGMASQDDAPVIERDRAIDPLATVKPVVRAPVKQTGQRAGMI